MDAAVLRDKLINRARAIQAQRQETIDRAQAAVAHFDSQLAAMQQLRDQWDTLTIEQALTALQAAGIDVKVG